MSAIYVNTLFPQQFKDDFNLTEIKLGNSILTIPRECFQGCANLKRITIPRSVKKIDFKAFANSGIQEVIFEENSSLRVLSSHCFEACSDLVTITLPPTTRTISSYSFSDCPKLIYPCSSATQLRIIGYSAFQNCFLLGTAIHILENVREIGVYAFFNSNFSYIEFCPPAQTLDEEEGICSYLNIGHNAFKYCTYLQSLNIPSSINFIGTGAFSYTGITNVKFPTASNSNWTSIPKEMFRGCDKLGSISIPSFVTSIGYLAFSFSGIKNIEFKEDSEAILRDPLSSSSSTNNLLYIGELVFSNCRYLSSIHIPSSVRLFDKHLFFKSNIVNVIFPQDSQLQIICEAVFTNCSKLETIILPFSLKIIGKVAFSYCTSLRSIAIPSSVISINTAIFTNSNLDRVIFSQDSQLQILPDYIFSGCLNLESIIIPSSIRSIGKFAFSGCKLNSTTLANIFTTCNIHIIGDGAFSNCGNLQSADISSLYQQMDDCDIQLDSQPLRHSTLGSITIPSSVISVGKSAFKNSNMNEVVFAPDSQLTSIPDNIFRGCYSLKVVKLPSSIKSIGKYAFAYSAINTESLEAISTNCNIQHIDESAFLGLKITPDHQ